MFGDVYSTGAFSGIQLLILGVLAFSLAATLGLYLLGLPLELVGIAFVVIAGGSTYLARPLFRRFIPRFDSPEDE